MRSGYREKIICKRDVYLSSFQRFLREICVLLHGSMCVSEIKDISKNSFRMKESLHSIGIDLFHLPVIKFENTLNMTVINYTANCI